jgi:hypothetical protein
MAEAGHLAVPASLPCGEPLRAVLARLLAPSPPDRYQSARDVRDALLAGVAGAAEAKGVAVAPYSAAVSPVVLEPVPRRLEGETRALLRKLAYSPGTLMEPREKPGAGWNVADVFLVALGSIFTAGVLPAVFWSHYLSRKKRLKRFLVHGLPATAQVLGMEPEDIGFGAKLSRVRYEFEADGRRFRDFDLVLPPIAERWDPGTLIQVLYLPDRDYDSVIVSTS